MYACLENLLFCLYWLVLEIDLYVLTIPSHPRWLDSNFIPVGSSFGILDTATSSFDGKAGPGLRILSSFGTITSMRHLVLQACRGGGGAVACCCYFDLPLLLFSFSDFSVAVDVVAVMIAIENLSIRGLVFSPFIHSLLGSQQGVNVDTCWSSRQIVSEIRFQHIRSTFA